MSIEAMKRMVAALEDIKDDCCGDEFEWLNDYPLQCAALEEGRKAIAEAEKQEPVAWVYPEFWTYLRRSGCATAYANDGKGLHPDGVKRTPLYAYRQLKP